MTEGILVVDRYAAYKAIEPVKDDRIVLAFYGAHVRRDFLGVDRNWCARFPLLRRWRAQPMGEAQMAANQINEEGAVYLFQISDRTRCAAMPAGLLTLIQSRDRAERENPRAWR